jgi:outer membrane protein TolC
LYNEGFDDDSRAAGIGVSLRIPLWDENKAEKERIRAEQQFVDSSLQSFDTAGYPALLRTHYERAKTALERAETYRSRIVPAYEKSLEATRNMLRGGQASSLQLWQVHERLHEAEEKALDMMRDAFQSHAELETLVGQPLEVTP